MLRSIKMCLSELRMITVRGLLYSAPRNHSGDTYVCFAPSFKRHVAKLGLRSSSQQFSTKGACSALKWPSYFPRRAQPVSEKV